MFLIEIYFARLYNAHLLFHKETIVADFVSKRVPDFVSLAIFASATMHVSHLQISVTSRFIAEFCSFLRQLPRKAHPGSDGNGFDFRFSMLSAADWASPGDEARPSWAFINFQYLIIHLYHAY